MNLRKTLIIAGLLLFLNGCTDFFMICSLNPFYLDKNVVLEADVEGNWMAFPLQLKPGSDKQVENSHWNQADTTSLWKIERFISKQTVTTTGGKDSTVFKPMDHYVVKLISNLPDSSEYEFRMVLFRVNKVLYADFMPVGNTGMTRSLFATESYLSVHTLARVVLKNDQLEVSWLSAECVEEMIGKKHVRISYRWSSSAGRLLLTGTPEQLTGMIDRFAGQPRFIDWESQQAMLKLNKVNQ